MADRDDDLSEGLRCRRLDQGRFQMEPKLYEEIIDCIPADSHGSLRRRGISFGLAAIALCLASPCAMADPTTVTLFGLEQQNLGFVPVPGTLVVCEGKIVGGLCDSEGVSDIYTFEQFGIPVSSVSDPKEFFELIASDFDSSKPLIDQGDRHIEEGDLYSALTPIDPGYDLTDNSAVVYTFAPSALEDIPEPRTVFSLWFGAIVITIIHHHWRKSQKNKNRAAFSARVLARRRTSPT
jgi:hypothetical protein